MNSTKFETLVGAIVILAAFGFFIFAAKATGFGGTSGGYHISAQFDNVDGVAIGSDVRVAGIKVGTVVGQHLDPKSYQAQIDMVLQPQVQLADDTSAKITSEGLLGSKFVALDPGGSDTTLKEGSIISYTQGAVDIWSLISQAMFSKSGSSPTAGTKPIDPPATPKP